jgi:phosphatidylserine decarboxylase
MRGTAAGANGAVREAAGKAGPPGADASSADPSSAARARSLLAEDLHFLLTNRIPRHAATRFMHWFSRLETWPVPQLSIGAWRLFSQDLDLGEAAPRRYRSLNDCFTRALRPGARTVDPDPRVWTSPCDGIVGAHGRVEGTRVWQAKGFPYRLEELLPDPALAAAHRDGWYATLRLSGGMYHRFHAPCDGRVRRVEYVSGDTWNVHPIALRRVERLFCRNERAVLPLEPALPGARVTLVAVAAVLVASIALAGLPHPLDLAYRGPNRIAWERAFAKGEELGRFEQGSTILVFANGPLRLHARVREGLRVRMGEPLLVTD